MHAVPSIIESIFSIVNTNFGKSLMHVIYYSSSFGVLPFLFIFSINSISLNRFFDVLFMFVFGTLVVNNFLNL